MMFNVIIKTDQYNQKMFWDDPSDGFFCVKEWYHESYLIVTSNQTEPSQLEGAGMQVLGPLGHAGLSAEETHG